MSKHVIINLAEAAGSFTGVTSKVQQAVEVQAGSHTDHHGFLWLKTRQVSNATVYKFDLAHLFKESLAGSRYGIPLKVINKIREKVEKADSVFYCAHGSASDTDTVFTDIGKGPVRLCSTADFASFAQMILPTTKKHDLRLIVCFAARSVNPDSRHTRTFLSSGANNYRALKSSLAYKFYKRLHEAGIQSRMYARLGEVRVSASSEHAMDVLTQTEDGVLAGLEISAASKDVESRKVGIPDMRIYELTQYIRAEMDLGTLTTKEQSWVDAYTRFARLTKAKAEEARTTGNGRLSYDVITGRLHIGFEGHEIYSGPML